MSKVETIMISVNKIEIPQDSIFNEMQYHPSENIEEAQFRASRSLIIDELFRQRAIALGLINDGDKLTDAITDDVLAHDVDTPQADDAFCHHYFKQNMEKFQTFPLMALRHILLKAAPEDFEARDEMRELAQGLVAQLQEDPGRFSQLALQYSSCPSKETEGQLGQITKGQTVPEFEEQVIRFEEGLIATPIESRYGYHVVWVDKKIEGKQLTFDMVKDKIANYLNEKVWRKAIAQYIAQRINESDIQGIDLEVDERHIMQ